MTNQVKDDLASHLRLTVTRLARRLRQEASVGLSPSQGSALAAIERHGPITPSGLADLERIQRPTATKVIAKLEQEGLVARERSPEDGRACTISLSPQGRALIKQQRGRKNAYLARRLRELEPDERDTLDRAAEILERMLREER